MTGVQTCALPIYTSSNLMILRLGFVLILNSVVSIICLRIESIPRIFILIGRNTLLIYVVHLVILYGSAWNPGLSVLFDKAFDLWNTLGSAVLIDRKSTRLNS